MNWHRALGLAGLLILALSLKGYPQDSTLFKVEKINDHVYAFITPDPLLELVDGNSYAILTDDGVVVIDAHHVPMIAEANIAEIRRLTDKPVRYLINSHWHGDHNTANSVYRSAFPDISIIAQEKTREILARRQPEWIRRFREGEFDEYVTYFEGVLDKGTNHDGAPLSEADRSRIGLLLDKLHQWGPSSREVVSELPDVTFDRQLTLHLTGREIQIRFEGRANTPGDAIVWLPQDSILITGDVVVHPIPYCFGSFYRDWVTTLDTLIAMNPKVILPGHGEPMYTPDYLHALRDLFSDLIAQTQAALDRGITNPDSVMATLDLSAQRERFAGDDPLRNWAFDGFFLRPSVPRLVKELQGERFEVDDEN